MLSLFQILFQNEMIILHFDSNSTIHSDTLHSYKEDYMKFKLSDTALLQGDPAIASFDMLEKLFINLQPEIKKARVYAKSSSPVLIEASAGPELEMLAQAIHNGSQRKGGSYAVISLSGTSNEEQLRLLFGDPKTGRQGAILDCNHGTLMIQGIDKLTLPVQSQLARVMRTKRVMNQSNYSQYRYVDIRIIASTSKNLTALRNQFLFRSDLLFTLRALRIRIPKLKDRPDDIRNMLDFYFQDFNRRYSTRHILSEQALETIVGYSWDSNIMQLAAFCERMILTAPETIIGSDYVKQLFIELYESDSALYDRTSPSVSADGSLCEGNAEEYGNVPVINEHPLSSFLPNVPESNDVYRDILLACLRKNRGSRKLTAKELGISTTTLWRKIRYYHLDG